MNRALYVGLGLVFGLCTGAAAQTPEADRTQEFLAFVKAQAAALRSADQPPTTAEEWAARKAKLRDELLAAWGGFPTESCPLEPRKLGELDRDGYRVEKLVFQTLPGLWMTALAYVPDGPGPFPAILSVHGHWSGAKQDPVVQSRCIGAAKHGFFVLAVDALGAGERSSTSRSASITARWSPRRSSRPAGHCPACRSMKTCGRWTICSPDPR